MVLRWRASPLSLEAAKQTSEDEKMVHNEGEAAVIERGLEVLSEHGFEGMAEAMQMLLNGAMKLERAVFLGAAPGERTASRARRW